MQETQNDKRRFKIYCTILWSAIRHGLIFRIQRMRLAPWYIEKQ